MAENIVVRTKNFTAEVLDELKKVTWPDMPQLRSATGVIIVFVVIVALIILLMDVTVRGLLNLIMGIFTG